MRGRHSRLRPGGSWHPAFSAISHAQPPEPDLNRASHPRAESLHPSDTAGSGAPALNTPVYPKGHKDPHELTLYSNQISEELCLQTPSHLKSTKPFVLSAIRQQFAFFLGGSLKNGLTPFYSTASSSTTFLPTY